MLSPGRILIVLKPDMSLTVLTVFGKSPDFALPRYFPVYEEFAGWQELNRLLGIVSEPAVVFFRCVKIVVKKLVTVPSEIREINKKSHVWNNTYSYSKKLLDFQCAKCIS